MSIATLTPVLEIGAGSALTNSAPTLIWVGFPLHPDGIDCEYRTAEHAYQAHKAATITDHNLVAAAPSALLARQRGNRIGLRPGWETGRYEAMLTTLRAKFAQHPHARETLLATGVVDLHVMEAGEWGAIDGQNLLGRALMRVRAELTTHTPST